MAINNSQNAIPATELIATMTGVNTLIGVLTQSPVIIIFNNLSTVTVNISIGLTSWMTFAPGQALVLDMRANHGNAPNYTFPMGTAIYGNGASGEFSVSYVYAQNT